MPVSTNIEKPKETIKLEDPKPKSAKSTNSTVDTLELNMNISENIGEILARNLVELWKKTDLDKEDTDEYNLESDNDEICEMISNQTLTSTKELKYRMDECYAKVDLFDTKHVNVNFQNFVLHWKLKNMPV